MDWRIKMQFKKKKKERNITDVFVYSWSTRVDQLEKRNIMDVGRVAPKIYSSMSWRVRVDLLARSLLTSYGPKTPGFSTIAIYNRKNEGHHRSKSLSFSLPLELVWNCMRHTDEPAMTQWNCTCHVYVVCMASARPLNSKLKFGWTENSKTGHLFF